MKKIRYNFFKSVSMCIILVVGILNTSIQINSESYGLPHTTLSCTNFAASFGDQVLFGNSEDGGLDHPLGIDPLSSHMFYYAADSDDYGCAFVGWLWEGNAVSIQGGMNDQGLCYDLTGIPDTSVNTPANPTYTFNGNWVLYDVLRKNANVDEVINFLKNVDWDGHVWFQWLFTDALGDIVIISPGADGELVFTRKLAGEDGFFTQTNFNRANNKSGDYPCRRYEASYNLLNEIESEDDLNVSKFNTVLEAVYFEKGSSYTGYSNVFDPVNQMLYLTYMGQFDDTVTINVTEELSVSNYRAVPMTDYFSAETVEEGLSYFRNFKTRAIFVQVMIILSVIIVIGGGITSGIYFAVRKIKKRKSSLNQIKNR